MAFNEKFIITPNYIPKPSKRRSGLAINKVRFIVAHDTDNPRSTAAQNAHYFVNSANEASVSAHLFVDDKEIIECIPALTASPEKAWHVLYNVPKDNELYGVNANDAAIGVEYCYGDNIDADKAYAKYIWVMAKICYAFKLDPSKDVVGHFFLDPDRKTDPITALAKSRRTYDQMLRDIVTEYNQCTGYVGLPNLDVNLLAGILKAAVKLNVRKAPTRQSDIVQVIPANTAISFVSIVNNGEPVNNNPIWYKDANGNYVWSGGVILNQSGNTGNVLPSSSIKKVKDFIEHLSIYGLDLLNLAIEQNEQLLKKLFNNIRFLNACLSHENGKTKLLIDIFLSDFNVTGMPAEIAVKPFGSKTYSIQTQIITGLGKIARISSGLDGSIENRTSSSSGSGCCILFDDNNNYLLTNCHVLTGGDLLNPLFDTGSDSVLYEDTVIGSWFYGTISNPGDFALVSINNLDNFLANNEYESFNGNVRTILPEDIFPFQANVRAKVSKTNTNVFVHGILEKKLVVEYNEGNTQSFDEAIMLGNNIDKNNCFPVTGLGDSGGVLYDNNMNVMGIITAFDDRFSYAIPIQNFITSQNLTVK